MVRLAHVDYDSDGTEPPLLIAPGLFGTARNWNANAKKPVISNAIAHG